MMAAQMVMMAMAMGAVMVMLGNQGYGHGGGGELWCAWDEIGAGEEAKARLG